MIAMRRSTHWLNRIENYRLITWLAIATTSIAYFAESTLMSHFGIHPTHAGHWHAALYVLCFIVGTSSFICAYRVDLKSTRFSLLVSCSFVFLALWFLALALCTLVALF